MKEEKTGWFSRMEKGIITQTKDKKESKEGLWYKCPSCNEIIHTEEHEQNIRVCLKCDYHDNIPAVKYFELIFDNNEYTEINAKLTSADPLNFTDRKKYSDRLRATQMKTGLKDAITTVYGKINGQKAAIAAMNFEFIGGSMGSVMGEKIVRLIDHCIKTRTPLIIMSKSGGARMMEAAFSLMQMAKVSAKLTLLSEHKIPYISFLLNPTTGGVTASYAMLGDVNIAEPGALIGFAGPRVIRETIGRDLPEGFQRSEFVLEHGFLDYIVHRKDIKKILSQQLRLFAS